jgi:hypothetical protein
LRSQADPEQDTEQEPEVQVTWQVALSVQLAEPDLPSVIVQVECSQVTLPLSPEVSVHVLDPLQSALHEVPQVPVQVLLLAQLNEQLCPVHPPPCHVQLAPDWHVHIDPLHGHEGPGHAEPAGGVLEPQLRTSVSPKVQRRESRMFMIVASRRSPDERLTAITRIPAHALRSDRVAPRLRSPNLRHQAVTLSFPRLLEHRRQSVLQSTRWFHAHANNIRIGGYAGDRRPPRAFDRDRAPL